MRPRQIAKVQARHQLRIGREIWPNRWHGCQTGVTFEPSGFYRMTASAADRKRTIVNAKVHATDLTLIRNTAAAHGITVSELVRRGLRLQGVNLRD